MKTFLSRCQDWIHAHPFAPLELVRIYVGVGLFVKGIYFLRHPEVLDAMLQAAALPSLPWSPANYVIGAHVAGGLLLAAGLFTRLAALMQVPIFFGAIVYGFAGRMATFAERQGFEFAGLMFFVCGLLVVFGGGPRSVDRLIFARWGGGAARDTWVRRHPDAFLDLVRVFLGVALFIKGIFFMMHRDQLNELINQSGSYSIFAITVAHYVIPVHLAGGVMLALGVLTRVAALAQLPVLFMAVFYVFLPKFVAIEGRQDVEFTALVLFLVLLLAAFGSGRWSIEHRLAKSAPSGELEEKSAI